MRKTLLIFLVLVFGIAELKSYEPAVPLPPAPTRAILEVYTSNDEVFALKLLEYYEIALIYRTQIKLCSGAEPSPPLAAPTYIQLTSLNDRVLRQYYNLAKAYYDSIKATGSNPCGNQVNQQNRQDIITLQAELENERQKTFNAERKSVNYDQLRKENKQLVQQILDIQRECDSIWVVFIDRIEQHRKDSYLLLERALGKYSPIISVSAGGHFLFTGQSRISSRLYPGGEVNLNLSKIMSAGNIFDVWFGYYYPRVATSARNPDPPNNEIQYIWATDLYSAGFNLTPQIILGNFALGGKIGVGYFWGAGRVDNAVGTSSWRGIRARGEVNFASLSFKVPMEVYASYGVNFYTQPLRFFTANEVLNLGRPIFHEISLGLRVALWREPHY